MTKEFWAYVERGDGCWTWQGWLDRHGYGKCWHQGKRSLAHRIAWTLTNGEIPDGLCVCHHCDNRSCVRPDHLFLGTLSENMADMVRKGRWRGAPHKRRISIEKIEAIFALRSQGQSQPKIALAVGVAQSAVSDILMGKPRGDLLLSKGQG